MSIDPSKYVIISKLDLQKIPNIFDKNINFVDILSYPTDNGCYVAHLYTRIFSHRNLGPDGLIILTNISLEDCTYLTLLGLDIIIAPIEIMHIFDAVFKVGKYDDINDPRAE